MSGNHVTGTMSPDDLALAYNGINMHGSLSQVLANVRARTGISHTGVRAFFHWKFSGVLIPFFAGISLGLINIGLTLDPASSTFHSSFYLADLFLLAAFAWSLGYWLTSDYLHKRNPALWSRKRQKREGSSGVHRYRLLQRGVMTVILLAFTGSVYETTRIEEARELSSLNGVLIPADDPMLPNSCRQIPDDALLIYMGFATSWVTQFPHTIIEVDGTPRLVIDHAEDKSIAISLDILGSDNKMIAELNKNKFTVSPHNYFKMVRKDRSSLTVFDDYKREVLNVRYLNPKALWINAELKYPGSQPVIFKGSGGGGICTGGSGRAEIAFETRK